MLPSGKGSAADVRGGSNSERCTGGEPAGQAAGRRHLRRGALLLRDLRQGAARCAPRGLGARRRGCGRRRLDDHLGNRAQHRELRSLASGRDRKPGLSRDRRGQSGAAAAGAVRPLGDGEAPARHHVHRRKRHRAAGFPHAVPEAGEPRRSRLLPVSQGEQDFRHPRQPAFRRAVDRRACRRAVAAGVESRRLVCRRGRRHDPARLFRGAVQGRGAPAERERIAVPHRRHHADALALPARDDRQRHEARRDFQASAARAQRPVRKLCRGRRHLPALRL